MVTSHPTLSVRPAPLRPGPDGPALPRTEVLHDYLTQAGGAERVALLLAQLCGGSLTTSAYLPDETHAGFRDVRVTALLAHLPDAAVRSRAALAPLAAAAFARHRVDADVVLNSSSGWSHWAPVRVPSVVYCYTPPRWFWAPGDYFAGLPGPALEAAALVSRSTRWVDRRRALAPGAGAPRQYLAISTTVRDRIREAYGIDARIVFPPSTFDVDGPQEPVPGLAPGFVLTIARDRVYKNIAAAQEVFATGAFGQLAVVGSRRRGPRGPVVDLGRVSEAQLRWLYAHCRAVLALSREDFGLTPVEGHRFGKPTLALSAGGYLDTCIPGVNAVLAASVDRAAITEALLTLDATRFDAAAIVATAQRFSVATFRSRLGAVLAETAGAGPALLPVPAPRAAPEPTTPPVRVHLTGSEWPQARAGGLNRYFEDLHQALRAHPGVEVTGAAFGPPAPGGTSWGPLAGSTPARVRAARSGPALRRGDVLDRHFTLYGQAPGDASLVVHFQGPWAQESRLAGGGALGSRAKLAVERTRLRDAARIVVLCARFKDLVVDDYGVDPARVVVLAPGVDLDRFTLDGSEAPSDRVVCVRRLEQRMGIDVLLRAWPAVLAARPGARLRIVGRGTQEDALRALAVDLGVADTVELVTDASDAEVVRAYREATVSVVPSVALEGFGLVALESMAVGRAPVVTDCGGLPDSVRGLDPTLVVAPQDPDALARRLVAALAGDRPTPQQCRSHAGTFSWSAVADAHVRLYREVAAETAAPTGPARRPAPVVRPGTVLALSHSARPGGAELDLVRQARHWPEGAVRVALAEDGPLLGALRAAGVEAEVVGARTAAGTPRGAGLVRSVRGLLALGRHGRELGRWADGRDVGVVLARSIKSLLYGAVAARHLGVPLVWEVHDRIAADYLGALPAVVVRALGRVLPNAYVVNSRATLATLATGAKPVLVAAPTPDPATLAGPPRRTDDALTHVVMVGRLAPWKGQHVFLEAFTRVFAGTDVRASIVGGALFGEDEHAASLERTAAAGPCARQITFTGHVPDVAARLRTADVVVHASTLPEPFGLVVAEGMAAGCAVIATTPGGPAEIITDGVDGLLVPCGDVDALTAALRRLADDPGLRQRLGAAGAQRARRDDPAAAVAHRVAWLRAVARGERPPAELRAVAVPVPRAPLDAARAEAAR